MITLPPLDGAVHDTLACPSPAVADTPVGAPGTVAPEPVTATSSRYIEVSSAGLAPSECTLNQSTTVWPA